MSVFFKSTAHNTMVIIHAKCQHRANKSKDTKIILGLPCILRSF